MNDLRICLLTEDSLYGDIAAKFIKQNFSNYEIVKVNLNDSVGKYIYNRKFDYIISFFYSWIVPEEILRNAKFAAINFHPAPPEHPGTGCYNFALYNGEKMFGTTCHHMLEKPDTGGIISVKRFPMFETDTVESLKERTKIYSLVNFFEVVFIIMEGGGLPTSSENWKREPRTRRDLDMLLEIDLDMSTEEIDKRIRATAHPTYPGPYIEIHGKKYSLRSG